MRLFTRKKEVERVFDLAPRTKKQKEVINLKPPLSRRYKQQLASLGVLIIIGSLIYARFFTQGAEAFFYPNSCLGTWQNVDQAVGKPKAYTPEEVQPLNSALFDESAQDIYCGGFTGEIPQGTVITKMHLRLAWTVVDTKLVDQKIEIPAETTSTSGSGALDNQVPSSVIDTPAAAHVDFQIQQVNPDGSPHEDAPADTTGPASGDSSGGAPASGGESSGGSAPGGDGGSGNSGGGDSGGGDSGGGAPSSFNFISVVHAQEADPAPVDAAPAPATVEPTPEPQAPTPEPEKTVPSETITPTPPTDIPVSSVDMSATSTPVSTSTDAGSAFLAIQYTLDGQNWQLLKNVTDKNWNETIDLPVTNWEDIAKLQIKISRLQTLDQPPYVYLDGMELGAEYDDGQGMEKPDFEQDTPLAIKSNEKYVVADTTHHADGKRVVWLFERTENPQWHRIADESSINASSSIALHGSTVLWISRDRRSIMMYRADTATSNSQGVNNGSDEANNVFIDNGTVEVEVSGNDLLFRNLATNITTQSDDDPTFSAGFWVYAKNLYLNASSTVATSSTSTNGQGSSTLITSSSLDAVGSLELVTSTGVQTTTSTVMP